MYPPATQCPVLTQSNVLPAVRPPLSTPPRWVLGPQSRLEALQWRCRGVYNSGSMAVRKCHNGDMCAHVGAGGAYNGGAGAEGVEADTYIEHAPPPRPRGRKPRDQREDQMPGPARALLGR
eukprot:1560240-Rhodomonas_salina.1